MQTIETLKRRIETAEDLRSVVRTMKTLAAVSIRQYEAAVASLTHYTAAIDLGVRMLLWRHPEIALRKRPPEQGLRGAVVFGSDQGMCGQFNEQIVSFAADFLAESASPGEWRALGLGARVVGRLEERKWRVDAAFEMPGSVAGITTTVQELLPAIDRWRSEQRLAEAFLFYNQRLSETTYRPHFVQLLPADPARFRRPSVKSWPSRSLPLITMPPGRLLASLVRQHLFVSLYRACAESLSGENAARIASMQAAQRNIDDRLADLRLEYQQLRQSSITAELLDIVTGAEALAAEGA